MKLSRICRVLLCIGVALIVLGLTTIVITSNAILAFDAPTPEAYQFLLIEQIGTDFDMKQLVLFSVGDTVTDAWKKLLTSSADCGKTCYGDFNGKVLYSTDTLDQAYEKVTGLTKSEFDAQQKTKKEEYMRKEEERLTSMPEKIEKYKTECY